MPEYYQPRRRKPSNISDKQKKSIDSKKLQELYPIDIAPKKKKSNKTANAKKTSSRNNKKKKKKDRKYVTPPISPAREKIDSDLKRAKERKKRRKRNYVYYYILLAVLAVIIIGVLSVTVLFNITNLRLEGNGRYTLEEIRAAAGIDGDENLIRLNTSEAHDAIIDKLVYVDSVTIRKDFPSALTFVVEGATTVAEVLFKGEYYSVSARGRILEISKKPTTNSIIFEGFDEEEMAGIGEYIDLEISTHGKLMKTVLDEINDSGLDKIISVDIHDRLEITMNYDNRIEMDIGSVQQLDQKLSAAKTLIDNEIDENEKVVLLLNNPERVVSRPVYDNVIISSGTKDDAPDEVNDPSAEGESTENNESTATEESPETTDASAD